MEDGELVVNQIQPYMDVKTGSLLRSYTRAASKDVQSDPFAKKKLTHGTADGGTMSYRFNVCAFFDVPLYAGR